MDEAGMQDNDLDLDMGGLRQSGPTLTLVPGCLPLTVGVSQGATGFIPSQGTFSFLVK